MEIFLRIKLMWTSKFKWILYTVATLDPGSNWPEVFTSIRDRWRHQFDDVFSEEFQGGGAFSLEKIYNSDFEPFTGLFEHKIWRGKNAIWLSVNEGKGVKGRWELFREYVRFGGAKKNPRNFISISECVNALCSSPICKTTRASSNRMQLVICWNQKSHNTWFKSTTNHQRCW